MKNIKTFDQLLDEKYGKKGTIERDQFDADSLAFRSLNQYNQELNDAVKSIEKGNAVSHKDALNELSKW